jgi:hypothetical protein
MNSTKAAMPQIGAHGAGTAATEATYEDEVHIRAVRRALANGNAAVMVGSGFSKNAEGGQSVGTWDDLAKALAGGLAADQTKIPFSAANATQLAEQYERLFSRPALEQVLKQVVPDERLAPGDLHLSLLSLPWAEVLTTNYDTLLERASERLVESSYVTICCREDIPQSRILGRRRIVKLHGSFASHRPFILTEEDYRRYPDEFAPFVNLVRQSLLENVLCLIGFSGDDPNFLHWIGWVRDMLDKHALPVYLFVTKSPGLGQRMLLQSRGVTPVVLPSTFNSEESDYQGRYRRFFELLNEPLAGSAKEWGRIIWSDKDRQYQDSEDGRYGAFKRALPAIAKQRAEYPGWLVAPRRVRRRLDLSVRGTGQWFDDARMSSRLAADEPTFAMASFAVYAWVQSTILRDLSDPAAEIAFEVLRKTDGTQFSHLAEGEQERLKEFGITAQSSLAENWTSLSLAVLAWARQGHRWQRYEEVKQLLKRRRSDDSLVADHIHYQDALRAIHQGERIEALLLLLRWAVGGSDAYMEVRRAALLAELGHVSEALSSCERAIQRLRQQQRLQPDDPLLLSQESWACLIAMQLHRGLQQLRGWGLDATDSPNGASSDEELKQRSDDFDERLKRLRSRGYAPDEELQFALEQLNQDAGTPRVHPNLRREFAFGLESRMQIIGMSAAWRDKIEGAQAWLQLTERVGLIARAGRVRYHDEAMLQAAWWIREVDPMERAFGLLIRSMREEALRPRNEDLPHSRTGWLSRLQIAQMNPAFACEQAGRLLRYIEHLLTMPKKMVENKSVLDFCCEAFGRLVVRVDAQSILLEWGERLLALYGSPGVIAMQDVLEQVDSALAHCIEASEPKQQRRLLLQAFHFPHETPDVTGASALRAPDVYKLYLRVDPSESLNAEEKAEWRSAAAALIRCLPSVNVIEERRKVWIRLFITDELGHLSSKQRGRIGIYLWKERAHDGWPSMEGCNPSATLRWPAPLPVNLDVAYRESLLRRAFRPLASGGMLNLSIRKSGRSWSLPADETHVGAMIGALDTGDWGAADLQRVLNWLEDWLDAEGDAVASDAVEHDDLNESLQRVIERLDNLLARVLLVTQTQHFNETKEVESRIWELRERLTLFGFPLWRLDMLSAAKGGSEEATIAMCGRLQTALTSQDDRELAHGYRAASWLLSRCDNGLAPAIAPLFDRMVMVASCRVMPALPWALEILSTLSREVWLRHLDLRTLFTVDASLKTLLVELEVHKRTRPVGIPEDAVPMLRSKCAQLSYALLKYSGFECPGAEAWIDVAKVDPLPELRLGRFMNHVDKRELAG